MFDLRSRYKFAPRVLFAVLGVFMLAGALLPLADSANAATYPSG